MNEKTREDFLRLLAQCDPKVRKTTVGGVGGRASRDRVHFVKEELAFVQADNTVREVTFVESGLCDCGKMITLKNPLKGTCQNPGCQRCVCAECFRVCSRCGRTYCVRHSTVYRDGSIYCNRCRPVKWLKLFFGIEDNGRKE